MSSRELRERLKQRLGKLYGAEGEGAVLSSLLGLIDRWRGPLSERSRRPAAPAEGSSSPGFSERDAVLIAYGDHLLRPGEAPLATLASWARAHLRDAVSAVHVLPFHPSTSYEGYSITDYLAVDPHLGSWADLERLGEHFELMMDLVLNHCSAAHPWFLQFLAGKEPGCRYFITVPDSQAPWLQGVFRARNLPLLHPFQTQDGVKQVWTTFSPDLVDLNWREPGVCLEICDVLLESAARGAHLVRLDAYVYVWKEEGTRCVNQPQNHELLQLFQEVLEAAGASDTAILPSITNVPQADNYAYFGQPDGPREADLIYNLPLSSLLLQALYSHDASALGRWIRELPPAPPGRAYLNLTASHDGIGLTWVKGFLPDEAIARLIDGAVERGALLSSRRRTARGEEQPWELNATYFNACAPGCGESCERHVDRFLATQSVLLALRGVPAIYFASLMAGGNDYERVNRTGDPRAINRGRFELDDWEAAMSDPASDRARVFRRLVDLLRARRGCPAFHPEGEQRVVDLRAPELFALVRSAPGCRRGGERILCITSFAETPSTLSTAEALRQAGLCAGGGQGLVDRVSGRAMKSGEILELAPYQSVWLSGEAADDPA